MPVWSIGNTRSDMTEDSLPIRDDMVVERVEVLVGVDDLLTKGRVVTVYNIPCGLVPRVNVKTRMVIRQIKFWLNTIT